MKLDQPSEFVGSLKLNSPVTSFEISHDDFDLFLRISERFKILFREIVSLTKFRLNSFSGCKLCFLSRDKLISSFFIQTRKNNLNILNTFLIQFMIRIINADSLLS